MNICELINAFPNSKLIIEWNDYRFAIRPFNIYAKTFVNELSRFEMRHPKMLRQFHDSKFIFADKLEFPPKMQTMAKNSFFVKKMYDTLIFVVVDIRFGLKMADEKGWDIAFHNSEMQVYVPFEEICKGDEQ